MVSAADLLIARQTRSGVAGNWIAWFVHGGGTGQRAVGIRLLGVPPAVLPYPALKPAPYRRKSQRYRRYTILVSAQSASV